MQFGGPRRGSGAKKKQADPLQKPVPKNPKYAHVRGKLQTGPTVKNRRTKFDTSGEIFKRVRTSTVFRMLQRRAEDEESVFRLGDGASVMTERTTASHAAEERRLASMIEDWDLLLLDVREAAAFEEGHISGAQSFPLLRLRRDQMPAELYAFRNRRGKVIVLYDEDGRSRLGIDMASDMVRKGFENTLLMSGGVRKFASFFPRAVVGSVPVLGEEELEAAAGPGGRCSAPAASSRPGTASSSASRSSRGGERPWK